MIEEGGWAMVPLVISSVLALGVVLERFWVLRRKNLFNEELLRQLRDTVRRGKIEEALLLSRSDRTATSGILAPMLSAYLDGSEPPLEIMERLGKKEFRKLQRNIGVLGTVAAIAPLLGLLGTVVGIIKTFGLIREHGIGNPQMLAGGISEALVATASGICIAVPSLIFFRILLHRARLLGTELEETVREIFAPLLSTTSRSAEDAVRR